MNKKSDKTLETILFLVFLIQITAILFSNLIMIDKRLDGDDGRLLNHIMMMAEERKLLIPDWTYPTTLEFDCTTLFALPLYSITGNIFLACSISNFLLLCIFSYTVFFLYEGKNKKYPLLALNFILIPYSVGTVEYFNMLFFAGTQYLLKIMVPLMLAALLVNHAQGKEKRTKIKYCVMLLIYTFLVFLTSFSSGLYVMLCGLFPLLSAYAIYKFINVPRIIRDEVILYVLTLLAALAGNVLNVRTDAALGSSMMLISVYDAYDYILRCFFGIFELMGGITQMDDLKPFSIRGVETMIKFFLTLMMLGCLPAAFKKIKKDKKNLFFLLMLSLTVWNFLVLCILNTTYGADSFEYRYHIMGMIPLMCIFTTLLLEYIQKYELWQQKVLYAIGIGVLLCLNLTGYVHLFRESARNAELKQVVQFCKESDAEIIYFLNDVRSAEACRAYDLSKIYVTLDESGTVHALDYYEKYDNSVMQEDSFIIVVNYNLNDWGETVSFKDELSLKMTDRFGNRGIYVKKE